MKHTSYCILLLVLICSFGFQPEKLRCHKTLTPEQLQEDFNVLITTLREAHPDLYRVNSHEVIDQRITSIEDSLKSGRTYLEFLKLIAPLFTEIGDINLQWGHSQDYIAYRNKNIPVFPIHFDIVNGHFVINDTNVRGNIAGTEITSINAMRVSDYLEMNYRILPTDGNIRTIQNRWLETFFPQHHSNFWEQPDTFNLELIQPGKDPIAVKVGAAFHSSAGRRGQGEIAPSFYTSGNIAVFSFPRFFAFNDASFYEFLGQHFVRIRNEKFEKLIIDLRGASFDDATGMKYGSMLYSFLIDSTRDYVQVARSVIPEQLTWNQHVKVAAPLPDQVSLMGITPDEYAFKGPVYILADGWTSNARGYFCAIMNERPNTFFAGEECGACTFGMNCCPLRLELPNSGISVQIPTIQFLTNVKYYSSTHGPAINIPMSATSENNVHDLIVKLRTEQK